MWLKTKTRYSGTSLRRTPLGPTKIAHYRESVSSGQGFIIHYVGYIWDSVSVHYRGMRVYPKRGSTVYPSHDVLTALIALIGKRLISTAFCDFTT